nr:hypothetical protein [Phenylobacterium sp.]
MADAVEPVLNALERGPAYKAFMLAGTERHVPVAGRFDIAAIDRLCEEEGDAAAMHPPAFLFGVQRLRFQIANDVALCVEFPEREFLQSVLNNRRDGLVPHQHLAPPGNRLVFKTLRSVEDEVTVQHTGAHAVFHLLAVLLRAMLRNRRKQQFDQNGVRVGAEFYGRRFQNAACHGDGVAKLDMYLNLPGQPRYIIDYRDGAFGAVLSNESKHRLHAGAVEQLSRHVVFERLDELVALPVRELANLGELALLSVALESLLGRGHPDIRDGNSWFVAAHARPPFSSLPPSRSSALNRWEQISTEKPLSTNAAMMCQSVVRSWVSASRLRLNSASSWRYSSMSASNGGRSPRTFCLESA